ncbi:hypothetical protein NUSPORA_02009 [Nucleospora cyclopteri]
MTYILLIFKTIITTNIVKFLTNITNILSSSNTVEFIELNFDSYFYQQFTNYFSDKGYENIKKSYLNQAEKFWAVDFDIYNRFSCKKTYKKIYLCLYYSEFHSFGVYNDLCDYKYICLEPKDRHQKLYKYMVGIHKILDYVEFEKIYDLLRANKLEDITLKEEYLDQKIIVDSLKENGGMSFRKIPKFIKNQNRIKKIDLVKYIEERNKIKVNFKFLAKNIKKYIKHIDDIPFAFIQFNLNDFYETYVSLPIQCNLIKKY